MVLFIESFQLKVCQRIRRRKNRIAEKNMKQIQILILLFIVLRLIFFFLPDQNLLLSASEGSHRIELYEKDQKFSILYDGMHKGEGKYSQRGDSIMLQYNQTELQQNENIAHILIINQATNTIESIDKADFRARIDVNNLSKSQE